MPTMENQEAAEQDLKQPGFAVGSLLVLSKGFPGNQIHLLHSIAGLAVILKHAHSGPEEIIHVGEGFRFECGHRWRRDRIVLGFRNHRYPVH